jgi:hypothetical protein
MYAQRHAEQTKADLLETLCRQRHDAGEPEIGAHWNNLAGNDPVARQALKSLRAEGRVVGRGLWVWVTEEAYAQWLSIR